MKRAIVMTVFCVFLSGCASAGAAKRLQSEVDTMQTRLNQQQQIINEQRAMLDQRDKDIRKMQLLLKEQDQGLRTKDEKIKKLRQRLEGFGVFE